MHTATRIYSRYQAANETMQEYIQRFTDLVPHGTDPTVVTCKVTIVLSIRHLFNKEINKEVCGTRTVQTLRFAMTLDPELEIKLEMYERFHDDYPSVMQISSIPQSEVLAIQGQILQLGNTQPVNQGPTVAASRCNWKANITCYKCGKKDICLEIVHLQLRLLLLKINQLHLLTVTRQAVLDLHFLQQQTLHFHRQ